MAADKNILQQFVKIVHDVLDPFVQMIGGTLEDKKEALAALGLDPTFANSSPQPCQVNLILFGLGILDQDMPFGAAPGGPKGRRADEKGDGYRHGHRP